MRKALLLFAVSLLSFGIYALDAEAARLGGGRSLGYQRSPSTFHQAPPAATPSRTPQATPARPAPSSGASRWLGPLAGLAAGGLLAALLFGDAFNGLQIMDFLLLAALGVGAFFIFRAMRGGGRARAEGSRAQPMAYAGAAPRAEPRPFQVPEIGGGVSEQPPVRASAERPSWFDEQAFLKAAKTHFIRLQAAWDKGDLKDISEYTTPELYAELSMQLHERGGEKNFTEVVSLEAELLDLTTEAERVIASVRFSGLMREQAQGPAEPFSEVWHVQRSLNEANANWYVAGIQQLEDQPA